MAPLELNDLPLDVLHTLMVSEMKELLDALEGKNQNEIKASKKQCERVHEAIIRRIETDKSSKKLPGTT